MAKKSKRGATHVDWKKTALLHEELVHKLRESNQSQGAEITRLQEHLQTAIVHAESTAELCRAQVQELEVLKKEREKLENELATARFELRFVKNHLVHVRAEALRAVRLYRQAGGILAMFMLDQKTLGQAVTLTMKLLLRRGYDADDLGPVFGEMFKSGERGLHKLTFSPDNPHLRIFTRKE